MLGMFSAADIEGIENAIHMAIAPAFLLTAIFAALNVLTQRLSRVVDRDRAIHEGGIVPRPGEKQALIARARCASRAITCCVIAAIMLCAVIVVSFLGVVFELLAAFVIAGLLMLAMAALIAALLWFLAEVRHAGFFLPVPDDDGR
jgi:hypothetical protein